MRRAWHSVFVLMGYAVAIGVIVVSQNMVALAAEGSAEVRVAGTVQNQDLRRVGQVVVEVKDQEGTVVATTVSNEAGEFAVSVPSNTTYSVSAVQETYRSEYVVLMLGAEAPKPVKLPAMA